MIAFWIALTLFYGALADIDLITCGSVLKLQNVQEKVRLHSHDVKYGSGSGQQSVTGMPNSDDVNSHWQILGGIFFYFCQQYDAQSMVN
jgi:dolichyl-phosphate-mannose--protein O-mannosyl transferase